MSSKSALKDTVEKCLESAAAVKNKKFLDDPAIAEASRLADVYENIKPNDYILPLDAMAGFPVTKYPSVE